MCRLRSDSWIDWCSAVFRNSTRSCWEAQIHVCMYVKNVLTLDTQRSNRATAGGETNSVHQRWKFPFIQNSSSDQIKSIPSRLRSSSDYQDSLASYSGVWIVKTSKFRHFWAIVSKTFCFFTSLSSTWAPAMTDIFNLSSVTVFEAFSLLFRGAASFEGYLRRAQFNNVNNRIISTYLHRECPGIGY